MAKAVRYWAVIPAAGAGARMQANLPKQYLSINGKRILEYTLEHFCTHPKIEGVIVAIADQDRYWSDLKEGILLVSLRQLVVRNFRTEVMDVVETDVAREPLYHLWQFIERTAVHARIEELPIRMAFPIGRVEIMLDIEQPDARTARDQQNGNLNQQEGRPADLDHQPCNHCGESDVRPDHTTAFALARVLFRETVRQGKDKK